MASKKEAPPEPVNFVIFQVLTEREIFCDHYMISRSMSCLAIAVAYLNIRERMTYDHLLVTGVAVAPIRDGLCEFAQLARS